MIDGDSPFTPGIPVPPDLFVGRDAEIADLQARIGKVISGTAQTAFLSGPRGIGKSSLASFMRAIAERNHSMVGVHVFLGGCESLGEATKRVFERVLRESSERRWYDPIKSLFGDTVKGVNLFGLNLTFSPQQTQLDALVRNFPDAIRTVVYSLRSAKKASGLVLILDDINRLSRSSEFANWLKSTIDAMAAESLPLLFLLVGLDERRQSIVDLQPSLARAFHLMQVAPWSDQETARFFEEAFSRVDIQVSPAAADVLVTFTGGLPFVAHEIGDAVFRQNVDKVIDDEDAVNGVRRAVEIMGRKFLQQQTLDAIQSKKYRDILGKVAEHTPLGRLAFERSEIMPALSKDERANLDNFLRRMVQLGVIVRLPDPGCYQIASHVHHLFLLTAAGQDRRR